MSDPRLNSIHLEAPRRQDYRRAREVLLHARGGHTLCAEQGVDEADSSPSNTLIQKEGLPDPAARLQCWLADDQYVYPLKVGLNTVGRSSDNDVVVADCFISRRHCAILLHTRAVANCTTPLPKTARSSTAPRSPAPRRSSRATPSASATASSSSSRRGDPRYVPGSPTATL